MIYTVTLNPAVDRELTVPEIEFDAVLRATKQRIDVGGKGFNISRMIRQLGGESIALGFVGGSAGKLLCEGLAAEDIATDFIWIAEESRTNISVVTDLGDRYFKVNEAGPEVTAAEYSALVAKILKVAGNGDWCVLSGSLPPGLPTHFYAELLEQLNQACVRTALDTSGEALALACQAKPFLVTPNMTEATELTGHADPAAAAHAIRHMGVEHVIVTQGCDGAILLEKAGIFKASPPTIVERNAIGAGDALVGGVVFALSTGLTMRDALCWGVASGTIAASLAGTSFGDLVAVTQALSQLKTSESMF